MPTSLRTQLISTILLALGLALLFSSSATASPARYVLEKCDYELPGGGVEGAAFHGSPPFSGAENCAEDGGSIFVVQQGDANGGSGYWSLPLPAPPGGYVENVTVTGSMCNGAYADAGTVAFAVQGGWALNCATQTHTFTIDSAAGSPGLVYVGCEGQCLGAPEAWAGDFAAVEVDPVAPRVSGLGGTLLGGGELHGHQSVDALAEDEGGGIAALNLRVNGQPVAPSRSTVCSTVRVSNPSYVGIVATRPTPCPAKVEASWTIDTGASPFQEGTNLISVCAQDFATIGSANEGCSSQDVDVNDSCPESGVTGGEVLKAEFVASAADRLTVPYGRGAEIAGELADGTGRPVPGAAICIQARTAGSSGPPRTVATTNTDADGHFTYKVAAGPDRRILIGYRHDAFQLDQAIDYRARVRPSLQASSAKLRNGQRVRFSGRLPRPAPGGRIVILQANVKGSKRWVTFRRATSAKEGAFRAGYRFRSTTRKTTYRFRAVVPAQAGYPWAQGHSKPVSVRVKP